MKVIKDESEALGLLMIDEDLFTYDTPLGMIFKEFNRLSGMDDDLFTYDEKIPKLPYLPNVKKLMNELNDGNLDVHESKMCYGECEKMYAEARIFINKKLVRLIDVTVEGMVCGFHTDVLMDPSNAKFSNWLDLKFGNHDNGLINDECIMVLLEERIETDIFHFETPLCKAYEEHKNGWIYEWNKDVPWVANFPWVYYGMWMEPKDDTEHSGRSFCFKSGLIKWPTCDWKKRGYCNGGDLPGVTRIRYETHFKIHEWYEDLENSELKEEALICKAIFEERITMNDESSRNARTHYSLANEWENFEHENHMEGDVNSNYNPYLDISIIFSNVGMNNGKTIQDEPELIGDDDDDVGYLEDYLIQKDPLYYVSEKKERSKEIRCKLLGVLYVKPPTCKTEKFEVVKYSFGPAAKYVAITEYEYDIWVQTEENVSHLYQDIFHKKNE
ncbi:hypothetical protein Tco_1554088 [Tanacetum coccineum]